MTEPFGPSAAEHLRRLWWLPLIRGVFMLILGFYALLLPGITIVALAQVVGVFLILDGMIAIIAGILGKVPSRGWTIARGALAMLAGAFAFANPVLAAGVTATALVYLLASAAILFGILEIAAAIRDRKEIEGEGWLMLGGAIMVLFGIMLIMSPLASGLSMIRIFGLFAIIGGIASIAFAFRVRRLGQRLQSHLAHERELHPGV
jgi:uncharacterized membrane protein HdeD (DUF308 family)